MHFPGGVAVRRVVRRTNSPLRSINMSRDAPAEWPVASRHVLFAVSSGALLTSTVGGGKIG